MAQNATAAFLMRRVEDVYGRMTSSIRRNLLADINVWADRLTRRWNFHFMVLPPGQKVIGDFPISDLSTVTFENDAMRWLDQGWLVTRSGQFGYPFAYPLYRRFASDVTDTPMYTQGSRWVLGEIKRIESCRRFSRDGVFQEDLEPLSNDDFLVRARYGTKGLPRYVTHTVDHVGTSVVLFSPKPDDRYLYSLSVRLATLPPLDKPDSSHVLLQLYPQVMVTTGLIEAAKYFGETRELEMYRRDLWGTGYGQIEDPDFKPGGMIGEMVAAGRGRYGRAPEIKIWPSVRDAVGRGGNTRRLTRGYYTTGSV